MRRLILLAACVLALLVPAAPAAAKPSWAETQIAAVVAHGLLAESVETFRPADVLTGGELADALGGLTGNPRAAADADRAATMAELDAGLVRALGLRPAARRLQATLAAAGLRPPARAGTEIVARLLALRFNHPAAEDALELLPVDPATRAEAAYSFTRALELGDADVAAVDALADSFELPELTPWQRAVLARAAGFVGYPYVWGGTSEREQVLFGVRSRGGFDCSGFVWRVYKLEPFAGSPSLGATLRGRTTYDLSGEMRRADRIPLERLEPGDLVFFGDRGSRSRPREIGHMGIYVGGGWFAHSSSQGTTFRPLDGWYAQTFAWGRRPLAEAGLD